MPEIQTTKLPTKAHLAPRLEPRKAPWESPPLPEAEEPPVERGDLAVTHAGETRGRRSRQFPDLNITATASKLGITKSHLAKVLSGDNRPSVELAVRLAEALGVGVDRVIGLYRHKRD